MDDLLVRSRIEAAARATGAVVVFPSGEDELDTALAGPLDLVVVGMAATRQLWPAWIERIKAHPTAGRVPLYAFGPHKDLELRRRALESGADRVLANSAFMAELARMLGGEPG